MFSLFGRETARRVNVNAVPRLTVSEVSTHTQNFDPANQIRLRNFRHGYGCPTAKIQIASQRRNIYRHGGGLRRRLS